MREHIHTERSSLEDWCRQRCHAVSCGETILARVLGKYIMRLDSGNDDIAARLMMDGFWEMWVTMFMIRNIPPGWHCADVGANHGYYTLVMADLVGEHGRVSAFEPNANLHGLLNRNVQLNGFDSRVTTYESGLGSKKELRDLRWNRVNSGSGTMLSDMPESYTKSVCIPSSVRPMGDILQEAPDFVKIDAEGMDGEILEGMRSTLKRMPFMTVLEYDPRRSHLIEGPLKDAVASGLKLGIIQGDAKAYPVTVEAVVSAKRFANLLLT